MSFNYNKVFLAGNLTRDVEVRFFANERAVASFGLACNRRYKDAQGNQKEDVTFVDIEAWGRTAELAGQYLAKGSSCFIEGRLKLETWEDKDSGQKRSKMKVVAESIQFTGSRSETSQAAPAPAGRQVPAGAPLDDEPPF